MNLEAVAQVQELRAENERLRRAKALREAYGVHFYRPHAKQDSFHRAADKTGRYCRTGNRGGKTKCGAAEDVAFCLGYRPWYTKEFDVMGIKREDGVRKQFVMRHHDPVADADLVTKGIPQRPIKLLLIVADWDKSKEIFTNNEGSFENWGEYFQLIPRDAVAKVNKSRGGHVDRIDIKRPEEYGGGVSSIYVDTIESYKHAKMSAESSDWDVIHLDEPCPEEMFVAHARGLVDRGGKFWINCTPITEMWINDKFTPNRMHVVKDAPDGFDFVTKEGASRYIITWSIWDNPYNSDRAIADFEGMLTRDQRACRLEGLPLAMAGLVYKEFVYDMHVLADVPKGWAAYDKPPKKYTVRVWWDVHISKPQAVLYFATAPDGTVYVYDEQFFSKYIKDNAELVVDKTKGYFVASYEIDPTALVDNPVDGSNIQDTLMEYGLFFNPATKDKTRGIIRCAEKLRERGHNELPTIYFSPNLSETLFEFAHYVYDLDTGKPVDKDDHMMENLYRAVLSGLEYVAPPADIDFKGRGKRDVSYNETAISIR